VLKNQESYMDWLITMFCLNKCNIIYFMLVLLDGWCVEWHIIEINKGFLERAIHFIVPLRGCAGHRVKLFQGNQMTSLSFPRGPYDIVIIKWEKRCFTIYNTLLHIIWHWHNSLCFGGPLWAGLLPASLFSAVLKLLKMYEVIMIVY
jgi:hypothetical protein